MISKEEQHAFEVEYKEVGSIFAKAPNKWEVNLFDGTEKEVFKNAVDAINFAKRKINIFQKLKQVPCEVSYSKFETKATHLLFTNAKLKEPFEVSDFYWSQIQINVDKYKFAKRLDQFSPISVTFNDIARAVAYTSKRKIKMMTSYLTIAIILIASFLVVASLFMFNPSNSTKILSIATNMPYQNIAVTVLISLVTISSIAATIVFLAPFQRFFKKAKDENGGSSYEGKSWKKSYLDRRFSNWVSLLLSATSVVLMVVANALMSNLVFFNSSIHSARTWTMIGALIAGDLSVIGIFGIVCGQIASTNNKRIIYLVTHVPPEDIDMFKAWTTHKRIESNTYEYNYVERFTFPPTRERLRVISEEIYPKKLRVSEKVKAEKLKDLELRYKIGLQRYKANKNLNAKKEGV